MASSRGLEPAYGRGSSVIRPPPSVEDEVADGEEQVRSLMGRLARTTEQEEEASFASLFDTPD